MGRKNVVIKDRIKIADLGNDFFKTSIATALNLTNSIVIDNLDSWLGNSVLREKYRAGTGLAHDEHEIKIAKIQAI